MKNILIISFTLLASLAFAQEGRHELPIDTIPIGGKEQEVKMTQLEGYDDLLKRLVEVRDSISEVSVAHQPEPASRPQVSGVKSDDDQSASAYRARLDELIAEMRQKENDENLMKQGYTLLNEIRRNSGQTQSSEE